MCYIRLVYHVGTYRSGGGVNGIETNEISDEKLCERCIIIQIIIIVCKHVALAAKISGKGYVGLDGA